jgi:hypothetical protein
MGVLDRAEESTRYVEDLERAVHALAIMVREEYPEGYTLPEIIATWGWALGLTDTDVAAVTRVEGLTGG